MKIVIMSDTHLSSGLMRTLNYEQADFAIHCGDSQFAIENEELRKFNCIVKGNCDFAKFPTTDIITINDEDWFVCHGHQVGYSGDFDSLANFGHNYQCAVVCSGHTHVPIYRKQNGIILLNPGSFARSRASTPNSYMTVVIDNGNWTVLLKRADNYKVIKEMTIE